MGKITDILKKFAFGVFNKAIKKAKDFFSKPKALIALQVTALAILTTLLSKLQKQIGKNISDEDAERYVKNDRNLQRIMNYIGNDMNNSIIPDITFACTDPDYYSDKVDALKNLLANSEGEDFIKIATEQSDFDERIDSNVTKELESLMNNVVGITPWLFLIYVIVLKVKEFLTQNDHPSKYRGKYLQRLIRNVGKMIKNIPVGDGQLKAMLASLKIMDAIIVGSLMATFVYLSNRKLLQSRSKESFKEVAGTLTCEEIEDPVVPKIKSKPFNTNVTCPVDGQVMVPHEPIQLKADLERVKSCEIKQHSNIQIEDDISNDIAANAIINNTSLTDFNIIIDNNQRIDTKTVLGTLGDTRIYSPIDGIVTNIESNKIFIGDISDPKSTYLEELMKQTQVLFNELNDAKFFIKDYYVNSLYPIMLIQSPLIDSSLSASELVGLRYFTGGITERFEIAEKDARRRKKDYEKNIKRIVGKNNVKQKAKNEELGLIKEEIDSQDNIYYEGIKLIGEKAEAQANATLPKKEEFELIEYFLFDLLLRLNTIKKPNDIEKTYRDQIHVFTRERVVIDGFKPEKIGDKINDFIKKLERGITVGNWFQKGLDKYNSRKKLSDIENWLVDIGKKNPKLENYEREKLVIKIMFLYEFYLEFSLITKKYKNLEEANNKEQTLKEGNYVDNYFGQLWKRYDTIPDELEEIYAKLEDLSRTMTTYSIVNIDDESYRYYGIGEERTCPEPEGDYTSPFTGAEYGDIKYWLKYCSITTLVGTTNFPLGWGTGIPPLIGPIPFPVVYIPIKSFQLKWGFIVIGITITGLYPYPWVLFTNFSNQYHVPFANPATAIKKQVEGLKKTLTTELKDFRQTTLKNYMVKIEKDVIELNESIDLKEESKRIHRLEKPKRDKLQKSAFLYAQEIETWDTTQLNYEKELIVLKTKRYGLETKYQVVFKAYNGAKIEDTIDPKIESMKKTEEVIDKQFEKLDLLISNTDKILTTLPISTKPYSANFAFTIKNPKPIINFADDLNDNVNTKPLNSFTKKFDLENSDLMSSNFSEKIDNSVINTDKYMSALKIVMPTFIKKDAFPKYENLKLTNVPWMTFLYKDWTTKGAQTYGFPGNPQYPTG